MDDRFPQTPQATADGVRLAAAIASEDEPVLFARVTVTSVGNDEEGKPTLILAIDGKEFGVVRTSVKGAQFFADQLYVADGVIMAFCKAAR